MCTKSAGQKLEVIIIGINPFKLCVSIHSSFFHKHEFTILGTAITHTLLYIHGTMMRMMVQCWDMFI